MKEKAKIIWELKENSEGKNCTEIDISGNGVNLMIGLEDICNYIATAMAEEVEASPKDMRAMLLQWLSKSKTNEE